MTRYTNFALTVIAFALVGIFFKDLMIVDAQAELGSMDYRMISRGIDQIVTAIYSIQLNCS